ncbi:MAG TPA: CAP domain-containing protein [Candidatus Dormibacteraeota bacterium]|nr:CAP domain-containing protein [Candidatus Dormibacteraeota bacterium]
MRLVSWLGGIALAIFIGSAVGAVTLAHGQQSAGRPALVAAQPAAGGAGVRPLLPKDLRAPAPSTRPVHSFSAPQPQAPPIARTIVVGSTQQALINSDRAAHGLGPLTWNACLYNVAVANARRIAAQGYLSHTNGPNVDLTCGLGYQAGENIGWYSGGIDDSWMNSKFMASPEHYANIMGPYHYVATAWVTTSDGRGWIAVEFG